jgi:hypothetical protein
MALAPRTVQNMPDCLSRPRIVLHPASRLKEQVNAELLVAPLPSLGTVLLRPSRRSHCRCPDVHLESS